MPRPGFKIILVTDRHATAGRPLTELVKEAVAGGVDAVQIREKDLDTLSLFHLAREVHQLCQPAGARLLINDRADVALATKADGVQLTTTSYKPAFARKLLGPDKYVSVSTHSLSEVWEGQEEGADFVLFGPVFFTASKAALGPPQGIERLAEIVQTIKIPVYAIGGIKEENVASVMATGAVGIALISGLLLQQDVEGAARRLSQRMRLH